eukprot:6574311-Ditylum_brightwellii.AAC.1
MIKKANPSTRHSYQKYCQCSDSFKNKVHYLGILEVDEREKSFVMSDWYLNLENNQFSFSKSIKPFYDAKDALQCKGQLDNGFEEDLLEEW